jgi:hypothetical protein
MADGRLVGNADTCRFYGRVEMNTHLYLRVDLHGERHKPLFLCDESVRLAFRPGRQRDLFSDWYQSPQPGSAGGPGDDRYPARRLRAGKQKPGNQKMNRDRTLIDWRFTRTTARRKFRYTRRYIMRSEA